MKAKTQFKLFYLNFYSQDNLQPEEMDEQAIDFDVFGCVNSNEVF